MCEINYSGFKGHYIKSTLKCFSLRMLCCLTSKSLNATKIATGQVDKVLP